MLVSFLQALLNMLRKEIDALGGPATSDRPLAASLSDAIQVATTENAAGSAVSAGQLAAATGDSISANKSQPPARTAATRAPQRKG
jgi:hypothetical protein